MNEGCILLVGWIFEGNLFSVIEGGVIIFVVIKDSFESLLIFSYKINFVKKSIAFSTNNHY